MTTPGLPDRDGGEVDALVTDRYLDALLTLGDDGRTAGPGDEVAALPGLGSTIALLRRSLVRVHPSFRFEERLAARLAALAAAQAAPAAAAGGGGTVIPFPGRAGRPDDPLLDAILAGELDPADDAALDRAAELDRSGGPDRRPLIVGGAAITSAALSIAGVAFVAWRASRPGARDGTPAMGRAVRSVRARRSSLAPIGIGGGRG